MMQTDVARQRAEQRDPLPNQHRHAGDHQTLDETRAQEVLNRDPAVDGFMARR
jgi:hypothetical protein